MASYIVILISLLLMSISSVMVGIGFWFVKYNFWTATFAFFALQIFGGILYDSYQKRIHSIQWAKINAQRDIAQSLQTVQLNCAYCNILNNVNIYINKSDNSFVCKNCNSHNNIKINFTTMRITTPVDAKDVLTDVMKKMDELDKIEENN